MFSGGREKWWDEHQCDFFIQIYLYFLQENDTTFFCNNYNSRCQYRHRQKRGATHSGIINTPGHQELFYNVWEMQYKCKLLLMAKIIVVCALWWQNCSSCFRSLSCNPSEIDGPLIYALCKCYLKILIAFEFSLVNGITILASAIQFWFWFANYFSDNMQHFKLITKVSTHIYKSI